MTATIITLPVVSRDPTAEPSETPITITVSPRMHSRICKLSVSWGVSPQEVVKVIVEDWMKSVKQR